MFRISWENTTRNYANKAGCCTQCNATLVATLERKEQTTSKGLTACENATEALCSTLMNGPKHTIASTIREYIRLRKSCMKKRKYGHPHLFKSVIK